MDENMLVGVWRLALPVPPALWTRTDQGSGDPLGFMTRDHQRVRDFAVQELITGGQPLAPQRIAQELQLAAQRVVEILDELERNKTFVFRNSQGAVTWAYPVTVEPTPHRISFSTGEQVYAA